MGKGILVMLLFFILTPLHISAQGVQLSLGIEHQGDVYFQENRETDYFKRRWSVDLTHSIGVDVALSYGAFGLSVGVSSTRLGLNKNNPDTAFSLFSRYGRPYFFKNVKYRASFIEIPISIYYTITHKMLNFKIGMSYSYYNKDRSFLKHVSYYDYNIKKEQEVQEAIDLMISGINNNFNSLSAFFELELKLNAFSFGYKLGLRQLTDAYHAMLIDSPFSIYGGLSVNYYLIRGNP